MFQYVVPRGGIFLGKWRSSFAGNSDCKMDIQSACSLNTLFIASNGWMMVNNDLEIFRKNLSSSEFSVTSQNSPRGTEENHKNKPDRKLRCQSRDSNRTLHECRSESLPLEATHSRWIICWPEGIGSWGCKTMSHPAKNRIMLSI
jgi:hypothetical protein